MIQRGNANWGTRNSEESERLAFRFSVYGFLFSIFGALRLALCALLLALCALLATYQAHAANELDSIKKTYSQITTVEAQFQQRIFITALKKERQMKGEFYYKRSKGFLWKYTTPRGKIFLYDGAAIWQAEEEKPFVIKERVDKEKMEGNFLDLVEDVTRLDRLFSVKQSVRQDEMDILELAPKKEGVMQSARIWVDKRSLIRRMEITEITGNVNTIEFSSIKVNKPLEDVIFVFEPGKKEIIER
jgi:chaperone LolA